MTQIELLACGGNLVKAKTALLYGADAVYVGGKAFSLRAGAGNLSYGELAELLAHAHRMGRRVYVTVNIYAKNAQLGALREHLRRLAHLGVDGVIVSDPGVVALAKETVPELPLHLSTQANTTNWLAAKFWEAQGIQRIIAAREMSLVEIKELAQRTSLEVECFVHGAMCIAYSGRCLLSAYFTGRSANQGDCAHPCRYRYRVQEEKRPGEYFPLEEDAQGTYIFSSKDLCMIEHIPALVDAGVKSFKIEGRMKSVHYVATVTNAYRRAIDAYLTDPDLYNGILEELKEELDRISHRPYSTGFYFGLPSDAAVTPHTDSETEYRFVGVVVGYDEGQQMAEVEVRNTLEPDTPLEILLPRQGAVSLKARFQCADPRREGVAHPNDLIYLEMPPAPVGTVIRALP